MSNLPQTRLYISVCPLNRDLWEAIKNKWENLVTGAEKEGGGSGPNHDLRF